LAPFTGSIEPVQLRGEEMGLFTRSLAAVVLTIGSLSIPAVDVLAQSPPADPPASASGLSDQKLDAAAAALERVVSLQEDYRQRIAQAEAAEEKQRIVAEANGALTKAVTDQGISVEEYTSILGVARDNPEIRGKILQRVRPADK
jgi:regulator of protease activity HflC (stomatin/prohibitin superfamily)